MERFRNNRDREEQEEQYRRMYDEIYERIYDRAFDEGYKRGKEHGYNVGYEHAVKDHQHNVSAAKEKHLTGCRWHGKSSKSWSWV